MASKISKTAFIKFEQCSKAFYFYKNHPYLRDPLSKEKQLVFTRGINVGKLAQQLFINGIDVSEKFPRKIDAAIEYTQQLISQGQTVIYEATFQYNGAVIMVDILKKNNDEWEAYEVKSSLKISETYIKDACYQYFVLKHALPTIKNIYIVTLNEHYVFDGILNIDELFKITSVKKDAEKNTTYFDYKLTAAKLLLEQNKIPNVPIGTHCSSPYACDYMGSCWKGETDIAPFLLGKLAKQEQFKLYNEGYRDINTFDSTNFKKDIAIQIQALKEGKEQINQIEVKKMLNKLNASVCAVDIEVWTPAIPVYRYTKPYEQIPFLISICSITDGGYIFNTYISPIANDNREVFLQYLIEYTKDYEFILVYDKSLEINVLMQLSDLFPTYKKEITNVLEKMIDMADIIHKAWYYHPEMKGQFSLKAISKALFQFDFEQLPINSGIVAMYAYQDLLHELDSEKIKRLENELINYCNYDTKYTIMFYEYLLKNCGNKLSN